MLNINFLACTKVELWDLIVCIAVNGETFQSRTMTLALYRTCSRYLHVLQCTVFKFHVPRSISF